MTSHPYMYDITPSIFMTSYPIYMISHIMLSWQHNIYTWHLTHYIRHHSHCICVITQMTHTSVSMYRCHHNKYGSHHIWSPMTSYTPHSNFMTSMISFYDITTTAFMTSDLLCMTSHPWFMTSPPLFLWHHSHYICNITPTMVVNSYPL